VVLLKLKHSFIIILTVHLYKSDITFKDMKR